MQNMIIDKSNLTTNIYCKTSDKMYASNSLRRHEYISCWKPWQLRSGIAK